ncbi:hypothetical protein BGZ98_003145 [Dissophora globulifera]|nr:hypothetical protein BGZ98_003145 [Dissophora globulifera]
MRFFALATVFLAPLVAASAIPIWTDLKISDTLASTSPVLESSTDLAIDIKSSSYQGKLYVRLNYATNIRDKNTFGKSDPYIEMWLDKNYKQSSKVVSGTVNPIYNESFLFNVRPGQDKLYLRVRDKDTVSDDTVGEATIPLDNVFNTGSEGPQDYKLPKWFGLRSDGSVNLQLQFIEG